jgi:hypothetical protein
VNVKWGRETGINEDGSTWWKESGEDLGENGFRSRWTVMGGRNKDGTSEWKETVSCALCEAQVRALLRSFRNDCLLEMNV